MQRYWFWPKLPISALLTHLYWRLLKNHKTTRLQTNKQYFSSFSFPKVSYYYGCLWMAIWKKTTILNIAKIQFLVFPLNLDFFRHEILQRPPIGQIWPLGHLGWLIWLEMSQIFDISSKKLRSESVPQMCKTAWALGLKRSFDAISSKII